MENLLRTDFTAHYGLPVATIADIYQETNEQYFEIEDDALREIQISNVANSGQAVYNNHPRRFLVGVINYDKFITSLNHVFQHGRKRCDLVVFTKNENSYFLLNELKESNKRSSTQLKKSLSDLLAVPSIASFANTFTIKRCCFFNKKITIAPPTINAVTAFNAINALAPNGLQFSHPDIELLGFEYYKYYNGHQFLLS